MSAKTAAVLIAAIVSSGGCSDHAELNEAKKKIAQLESELAVERAKATSPATKKVEPSPNSKTSNKADEPSFPSGKQWQYVTREDKMAGGAAYLAFVLSSNTVNFNFPYQGEQHGRLLLRTSPRYGKDVIFSIEKGQLLCRSYEDCQVTVRFDDGKPESYSGSSPTDNRSDTVFIHNYDRFVAKLRKAKIVRIALDIYQEGAPVFEFDVSGFDQNKYIPKK